MEIIILTENCGQTVTESFEENLLAADALFRWWPEFRTW